MAAARDARNSSLARLRQAYGASAGEARLDADVAWPGLGANNARVVESAWEDDSAENLENEWNEVAARTDELRLERQVHAGKIRPKEDVSSSPISYMEVQSWIQEQCSDGAVLQSLENCVAKGRQPQKGKDSVALRLRKTPFDFNVTTHFRMLRTVYTKLTHNTWCPSIGSHWEVLGFQAGDPRTDLNRSGGVLNVLHLFFFIAHHLELATDCFQLSQDEYQNFPLACISINITSLVMESLMAGRLSALCSKAHGDHGVIETTCKLHAAGLFYFCSRWRSQKRTIVHTEQTRNEVKALLERKPAKLLEELEQGAAKSRQVKKAAARAPHPAFADLETIGGAVQAPPTQSQGRGLWARSKAALPKRLRRYQDENASA